MKDKTGKSVAMRLAKRNERMIKKLSTPKAIAQRFWRMITER